MRDRHPDCMCARCEPEIRDLFRAAWMLARERDEIDAATVPLSEVVTPALMAILGRVQ